MGEVRHERICERSSQSAILSWSLGPAKVRVSRVNTKSYDGSVDCFELFDSVVKLEQLRWANKGPVQWITCEGDSESVKKEKKKTIPEEDNVFALELGELKVLDLSFHHSLSLKINGRGANLQKFGKSGKTKKQSKILP